MIIPAVLTALIESAVFAAAGYRRACDLALCTAVNMLTNLSLNLVLSLSGEGTGVVLMLEMLVVITEYIFYFSAYGRRKSLFIIVLASNLLSYLTGVLIYG